MYHHGNDSLERLRLQKLLQARRYQPAPSRNNPFPHGNRNPGNQAQYHNYQPRPSLITHNSPDYYNYSPFPTSTVASQNDPYLAVRGPSRPALDISSLASASTWNSQTDYPNQEEFYVPNYGAYSWGNYLSQEVERSQNKNEKHWVCPNRLGCTKLFRKRHKKCKKCPLSRWKDPGRIKCVGRCLFILILYGSVPSFLLSPYYFQDIYL